MSTVGGAQYRGRIPSFENLSTVGGYHDACGGYHEYRGVFSTVGYSNNKRLSPHGTHDIPNVHHDIPPRY